MVSLRRSFLLVGLCLVMASLASAQTPAFQCVANAGVPPLVRAEGLTELVGDLVLNCNNGTSTALGASVPQVNVRIFLNTNVTSRLVATGWNEAFLIIDEPTPANLRLCTLISGCPELGVNPNAAISGSGPGVNYKTDPTVENVYQGQPTPGTSNQVDFIGVPIDPPGTAITRIIRITNVRANANQLGVATTLVPTQIQMFISLTGATSIPVNNPIQVVAFVVPGLTFSVTGGGSNTQCLAFSRTITLNYTERFATAFKRRSYQKDQLTVATQNIVGFIYNTETGFYHPTFPSTNGANVAGRATQGTRLRALFTSIQAGVTLAVSTSHCGNLEAGVPVCPSAAVLGAAVGLGQYALLTATDANGAGGFVAASGTLTISSAGTALAVWEVLEDQPTQTQTYAFSATFAATPDLPNNRPGIGTANVSGSFAPVYSSTSSPTLASQSVAISTDNQPRFADTGGSTGVLTITPCTCNLLYPFLSNKLGFDTGIVVANTSEDGYARLGFGAGAARQNGVITITYFSRAGDPDPPDFTTPTPVNAGDMAVWTLSAGGTHSIPATPGFEGYMIVHARFQFCHGFAFISDANAARLSHGYLALVLDVPGLFRSTTPGESLGQ
jgi:hypothetical protein